MSNIAQGPLASDVRYFMELPDGGGNFQLYQVKTVSITDNATGETIIGGAGPIGNTFAGGGSTLSIETHRIARVPNEVDYEALKRSRAEFSLSMQDGVGDTLGTRYTWNGLQVTKIDRAGANDGNQTETIEAITALEIQITQPEPGA